MESKGVNHDDLLKDARFLEHVANSIEKSVEHNIGVREDKRKPFKSRKQRELVKVIRRNYSNTRLFFLPSTFSRAQQNKSYAHTKHHCIHWTIEVEHEGGMKLLHSLPDTMNISEFYDCNPQHYIISVYDEAPGVRKSDWIPLSTPSNMSIKEALRNVGIVEFPRFKFCMVETVDLDEQ